MRKGSQTSKLSLEFALGIGWRFAAVTSVCKITVPVDFDVTRVSINSDLGVAGKEQIDLTLYLIWARFNLYKLQPSINSALVEFAAIELPRKSYSAVLSVDANTHDIGTLDISAGDTNALSEMMAAERKQGAQTNLHVRTLTMAH